MNWGDKKLVILSLVTLFTSLVTKSPDPLSREPERRLTRP